MSLLKLLVVFFVNSVIAFPLFSGRFGQSDRVETPDFTFAGDAPWTVDAATLASALTCPNGNPTSSAPPVLLVHGTGSTGQESWGDGYVPALAANGYTPCYVTLPGRSMGDMQVTSEYVAYALHYLSYLSGNIQTAVITHSQGGPDTQWALQFWPSTHSVTSSFIALSPDFAGVLSSSGNLTLTCAWQHCQGSIWQQAQGSHYYSALHSANFGAQVPTTAIWTLADGIVLPPEENAALPSATSIAVQDLCPVRTTSHAEMPIDAAAFALAMDALQNGGTASLARVQLRAGTICAMANAVDMQVSIAAVLTATYNDIVLGFILGQPRVPSEPSVMGYAQAYSGTWVGTS